MFLGLDLGRLFRKRPRTIPALSSKVLENLKEAGLAVILIDMQKGFISQMRKNEKRRIMPNQIAVLRHCHTNNIPIIVLEYKGYGSTIRELRSEYENTTNYLIITKSEDNGFEDTNLDEQLKTMGIKVLFLMGINADCCVKRTARGALDRHYNIMISNDVISGQSDHSKNNSIPWYENNGATVFPVAYFLEN